MKHIIISICALLFITILFVLRDVQTSTGFMLLFIIAASILNYERKNLQQLSLKKSINLKTIVNSKIYKTLIQEKVLIERSETYFELKNANVRVTYDNRNNTIRIINKKIKDNYAFLSWVIDPKKSYIEECPYLYEFADILEMFYSKIHSLTYKDIISEVSKYYHVFEHLPKIQETTEKKIEKTPIAKIDINSANENELAKLAGINVVNAKKIINYRDYNGGFKTIAEFFVAAKIKKHYIDKLTPMIELKPYQQENIMNFDERILDI